MRKPRKNEPVLETRRVDELVPFPDQAHIFENLSPDDLKSLADDIRKNRLKDPVQILPANDAGFAANTIIDGHQRLAALRLLNQTEIPVLVRYDLVHRTRAEIQEQFAGPNLHRRHMTALQRLRAWLYYYERVTGKKIAEPSSCTDAEFLEGARKCVGNVGKGKDGKRHLRRLLKVLELPLVLQRCVDGRRLRLTIAERVPKLCEGDQQQIVARIEAGEAPNAVVPEYLPDRCKTVGIEQEVRVAMSKLKDIVVRLSPRMPEMDDFGHRGTIDRHRHTIADARQLLENLDVELNRIQRRS